VMSAPTLQEAIDYVNAVPYGLTSGIHSLDPEEIHSWTEQVRAGNLYINREITGAIVRRQPFGGWKRSSIGPGTKAGGANYLLGLTNWTDPPDTLRTAKQERSTPLSASAASFLEAEATRWLNTAIGHATDALDTYTGQRDVSTLKVEIHALRYRPVPVTI